MPESDFWRFSIGFYRDETVQQACLSLQDHYGGDVNVALYLLYRATAGDLLSEDSIKALHRDIAPWRETTVRPLREIRRALKGTRLLADGFAQELLRNKIKKIELDAEKLQQLEIERLAPERSGTAPSAEASRANLEAYGRGLGQVIPDDLLAVFVARLAAPP